MSLNIVVLEYFREYFIVTKSKAEYLVQNRIVRDVFQEAGFIIEKQLQPFSTFVWHFVVNENVCWKNSIL